MSDDDQPADLDGLVDRFDLYGNAVATDPYVGKVAGGVIVNTHGPAVCAGETCVLHNPSDHPLRDAPMVFRMDKAALVERTCEHGIGHPDPDSVAHLERTTGDDGWGVHGCDGCCATPKDDTPPDSAWVSIDGITNHLVAKVEDGVATLECQQTAHAFGQPGVPTDDEGRLPDPVDGGQPCNACLLAVRVLGKPAPDRP